MQRLLSLVDSLKCGIKRRERDPFIVTCCYVGIKVFDNDECTYSVLAQKIFQPENAFGGLIRNAINKFVQAGSVNKRKLIGRLPESEEVVGMTRAQTTNILHYFEYFTDQVFKW